MGSPLAYQRISFRLETVFRCDHADRNLLMRRVESVKAGNEVESPGGLKILKVNVVCSFVQRDSGWVVVYLVF